jgi:hypothetical protein
VDLAHSAHALLHGGWVRTVPTPGDLPQPTGRNRPGRPRAVMNADSWAATLAHPRETAVFARISNTPPQPPAGFEPAGGFRLAGAIPALVRLCRFLKRNH